MRRRRFRVSSVLLLMLVVCLFTTSQVFATDTPTANAVGPGGVGPYKSPGQMVKVMFYKPSDFGVGDSDWYTSKPAFIEVKSKSERTIWEMGTRSSPMDGLELTGSGQDAYALSQMYIALDGEDYTGSLLNLNFLVDKSGSDLVYADAPGAFAIVTNHVTDGSYGTINSYETNGGLLTCNNIYMRKFLEVTNNGKEWNGDKLAEAIEVLWAENVRNNLYLGSEGTRLRYDMARMLTSTPGGGLEAQYSIDKLNRFMNEYIKNGSTPPGMSEPITSDEQATNIRNLVLATFVMVQGNPDGGVSFYDGSAGNGHCKGEYMRDRLMEWARGNGNSDTSDFHCAIKFESYAIVDLGGNWARAERWDYANWASCRDGRRQDYIKPAMWATLNADRSRADTFSLGMNYVNNTAMGYSNPALQAYKKLIEGVQTKLSQGGMNLWLHWYNDPYTSRWSIFGSANPRADGTIYDGTYNNPNTYNYRGIFEYTPRCFEGGNSTVNLGYSFLAPEGKIVIPTPMAVNVPDFKEDADVSTKTTVLKGDAKGEVDVKYSLEMSQAHDADTKSAYNLQWSDTYSAGYDWQKTGEETDRTLSLIHRAFYYSEERLNSNTNKYLPIQITITRTNGGSGPILDELSGVWAAIRDCPGDHQFRVVSDNGGTAVVEFNMVAQTWCPADKNVPYISPIRQAQQKQDPSWLIENCFAKLVCLDGNTFDFKDKDIDTGAGKVEVKYDFKAQVKLPDYKEEPKIFGVGTADKVYLNRLTTQTFKGWRVLPTAGVYPNSDWKNNPWGVGYVFSDTIQRKVTFERVNEKIPTYTNQGYEAHHPYYAEIKTNNPTNEPFEAMAGTPTTENLYMSVGATDFRVSFDGAPDPAQNPESYVKYTYIVNVSGCYADGVHCTGCGSETQPCPGHWQVDDPETGAGHTWFHSDPQVGHTIEHPNGSHTWTYVVNIPIGVFNYFDITNSEVWRLTSWGLSGHEAFLTAPNPQKALATQFWGYNQQNYSSGNGRLIFNATQNSNQQGSLAKYGNQTRTFSISGGPHSAMVTQALSLVNGALASESPVGATVVSDYVVLGTSEGYQTPFFFTQDSKNTVTPSSAGTFSGEGGNLTCPTKIEFDEKKMDDYWWQNNNKLTCAQPLNGWDNRSITYGGYNGQYSNLSAKYNNTDHSNFVSTTNTAAEFFSSKSLSLNSHPNGVRDGGSTSIGIGKGNTNHIVTGLDVIDTTANGEYNTGKMWLQYNRVMFYDNNANLGVSSGAVSDFDGVNGVYRNSNIPYYANATKVNDIVIHDPVSAQYAIVKSNPTEYDLRTNAELMQGGDPVGTKLGACPGRGCQFSTLTCTRPVTEHTASCYSETKSGTNHVGGLNTHVCNDDCGHTHVESCYGASVTNTTSGGVNFVSGYGTDFMTFTATSAGTVSFYCTNMTTDPRGRVYVNGVCMRDDDDSNGGLNFNCGTISFNKGDIIRLNVYPYGGGGGGYVYATAVVTMRGVICGKTETGTSTGSLDSLYFAPGQLYCHDYYVDSDNYSVWSGSILSVPTWGGIEYARYKEYWAYVWAGNGTISANPANIVYDSDLNDAENYNLPSSYLYSHAYTKTKTLFADTHPVYLNPAYDTLYTGNAGLQPEGSLARYYWVGWILASYGSDSNILSWDANKWPGARLLTGKSVSSASTGCTGQLNTHVCTAACTDTYTKKLTCTDPHHYEPGQPVDASSLDVHYPIGDTRCWQPCYNAANHAEKTEVTLPSGEVAKMGGTFINIDREFTIYYPFIGDFAEDPTLQGIATTTLVRGKGYVNNMNTRKWTKHRWVSFPFDVIDPSGVMRRAYTKIDLNDFSTTETLFEFYCPLANNERAGCVTEFTSTAINGPSATTNDYFNDSDGITNKSRSTNDKDAKHSALKTHAIDVVGSIGAMTIHDTGDFRFATTFKMPTADGTWLVPNLIRNVDLTKPNYIAGDTLNVRHEETMSATDWLDTYGTQFLETGGKSGGVDSKEPIELPLTPADNVEDEFKNQPMRPGYQLYMDLETIGNYYGETFANAGTESNPITVLSDEKMTDKVQIRPMYYSLDLSTGKYTPVDVYYGVNGEYMQVNQYHFDPNSSTGVQNYYYYLDWLNESARRNYSTVEAAQTALGRQYHTTNVLNNLVQSRIPTNDRDILGSANVLFLNDLNRTYIGSETTSGVDKNPVGLTGTKVIPEAKYAQQGQRWNFTLGLPSSSVFVEAGKDCTEVNIKALQSTNRVILCTLDVKARGTVWTLDYSKGQGSNNGKFQVVKGGAWYNPPAFDENGNEVTVNASSDVTSDNVIVTVYPSNKTSADDVGTTGTH